MVGRSTVVDVEGLDSSGFTFGPRFGPAFVLGSRVVPVMATIEQSENESVDGPRRGRTTILLTRAENGRWRATQRGVDAEGYGESAPAAAAEYCRRVDEREG